MNRTIEAIMRHMVPPATRQMEPGNGTMLEAHWQDGPATDLGFRQQKLRLTFVRRHKAMLRTDSAPTRLASSSITLEPVTSH